MKKYICLFLSVLMLMSLSQISVFAEDETPIGPLPLVGINQTQYYEEDFDDFAVGTYVPAADGIQVSSNAPQNCTFTVTDDKMLKASMSLLYKSAKIRYDFETPVETGLLSLSMIMDNSKTTGDGAWTYVIESAAMADNTVKTKSMFEKHARSTFRNPSTGTAFSTQPVAVDGLYHLLVTISREDTAQNWNLTAYDVSGATPVAFHTLELAKEDFPAISAFYLTSYSMSNTLTTAIDDFELAAYESWKSQINYSNDFDDLEEREYTTSEFATLTGFKSSSANGKYEGTADDKLKINIPVINASFGMSYSLPAPVSSGILTAQMKVSKTAAGDVGVWHLFGFKSGANSVNTIDIWAGSNGFTPTSAGTGSALLPTQPVFDEETQMFHLRAVVFRVDENTDWSVKIYDDAGESPVLIYSAELAKENFANIDKFDVVNGYSQNVLSVELDDFSFKAVEVENNFAGNNTTDAVLSMALDESFITGDLAVEITKADDATKKVLATVSYDSGSLNITPESFLDYGTTYNVILSGCALEGFSFKTADAPLSLTSKTIKFVGAGGESETIPNEGTFDAVCDFTVSNPGGEASTVYAVLISYNDKGMIMNIVPEEIQFSGATLTDQLTIPGLTKANTEKVRCFIWSKTNLGFEMME